MAFLGKSLSQPLDVFPIVGVGASAGGLDAFTELLKHLPPDTGMGFVLVQHLDPNHESALTQLLSRVTTMAVREVTDALRVEPNCVYVIPPNTRLEIKQGGLALLPRPQKDRGVQHSIDSFFESLAYDARERAIGVILSGTASDGTLGLEAIKGEGGITFAQDESAKFDSMPRSAIAAGCVDFVLSPQNIALELARIASHPMVTAGTHDRPIPPAEMERENDQHESRRVALASGGHGKPPTGSHDAQREASHPGLPAPADDNFKKILLLLRNHCGVDFSLYKSSTIQRRVTRRIVLNHQRGHDDYLVFLKGNAKELDALYSDVLISVTSFFRNPDAFDTLKRKVFPALMTRHKGDAPIRFWTLGCSTGQEAYSMAMSYAEFADKTLHAPKLQIFATDLNEALLDKARQGLYAKSLAQDISPERLKRFFVEEQGGYRVSKALREQVVFARQNVMTDPPFSRMDLISCRNLLIYLEAGLQKKIMPAFHYALNPGGFLFLGGSESVGQFTELFEPADKKQKIFSRKTAPASSFRLSLPHERAATPSRDARLLVTANRPHILPEGMRSEFEAQREADRLSVSQFAPPGVLINAELHVLQFRGATGDFLEPPVGKASFNVLKMARHGLMLPLRSAINLAKRDKKTVRKEHVRIPGNGEDALIHLQVIPLKNLKERYYLILFENTTRGDHSEEANAAGSAKRATAEHSPEEKSTLLRRVHELESELAESRDFIQSIQEQYDSSTDELQASSEEVQSTNEELQSINEELETSKEELESTNEELMTMNEEMVHRNAELKELNSDLNNLHVSIDTAVLVLGRDLTIRRFTVQAEKLFNLLSGDVGRPLSGIRHNLEMRDLDEFVREVVDTASVAQREVQDKKGHWYSLRARPYVTLDNKIDGAVLVLVDIDMLKTTERGLRMSEAHYQTLFNLGPVAIYSCNAKGEIQDYNSRAAELWGRRPKPGDTDEKFCGSFKLFSPDGPFIAHDSCPMAEVLKGAVQGKFEGEVVIERPDGSRVTVLVNIASMKDENGTITGAINCFVDITERKRLDAILRENIERLRFMAESMPQKIFTADAKGAIDYFNQQWMDFTGLEFDQIKGWNWNKFIHPDEAGECVRLWRQAIDRSQDFQFDFRIRRKDGIYRWHLTRAKAMLDLDGKVLMWIGSTTDVDDARRTLDELSRSERAKDDFLAALSHELRTPLAPVLLIAATLRENKNLSKDVHDQIDVIEHNIGLEARLIDDLLDITKISHGKLLFRAEMCDAHRLIESTLEIVREDAEAKHISVERNLSAQHSRLMADPTRFQQVVWNLLRNAVKFTPRGGKVSIATRETRLADGTMGLRIEIGDSGIGIASENLEKIFEAFEQGHRASSHQFGGLGLGLTIARAVVKLHGGTITAYSAGLNQGASFVVELPGVIDTAAPFPSLLNLVTDNRPTHRLNLLLVEDHTHTRKALKALLLRDGYRVSDASTVAEALELAGAQKFDLVISDLGLPDGPGTSLMEQLRDRHGLVGIALTGYGMEENIIHTRASGFLAHLVKPVSADELRRTITLIAENLKAVTS